MSDLRIWVKVALFLSSYIPLWIIFAGFLVVDTKYGFWTLAPKDNLLVVSAFVILLSVILGSLAIVGFLIWNTKRGKDPKPIIVKEKEEATSDYLLYVVSYMIPFVVENFLDYPRLYALTVMMITIGVLYIRANLFHVNPTLNAFGYMLYKVSDFDNNKYSLLSKKTSIKKNDSIDVNSINQVIYLDVGK